MDTIQDTQRLLTDMQACVESLSDYLSPCLEVMPRELDAQLNPLERCRTHLALAQACGQLLKYQLALSGVPLPQHPITPLLERLAAYDTKVRKAVAADDLVRSRPGASLNVAAANRFISAAIPDLTPEQRKLLRAAGEKHTAGAGGATAAATAGPGAPSTLGRKAGSTVQQQQQQQQQTMPGAKDEALLLMQEALGGS